MALSNWLALQLTFAWVSSDLETTVADMIPRISRNSKRIIAVLSQYRSPKQIASGVAIGITLGLIPKDNLIALLLIASIAFLRVNQLMACCTGIGIGCLSGWFGPVTAAVGEMLLNRPIVRNGVLFLFQFPALPWTYLDNSVVVGGLAIGLVALAPAYLVCLWSITKATNQLENIALEQVANNAIEYRKSVLEKTKSRHEKPSPSLKLVSNESEVNAERSPTYAETMAVAEDFSALQTSARPVDVEKNSVHTSLRSKAKDSRRQRFMPTVFTGTVVPDGNDTLLRETVIEVVRYRKPVPSEIDNFAVNTDPNTAPPKQGIPMRNGNTSTLDSKDSQSEGLAKPSHDSTAGQSITFDAGHVPPQSGNRDDSLKYLLWHINGSRENVRKSSEKSA